MIEHINNGNHSPFDKGYLRARIRHKLGKPGEGREMT
jgi:hypothetical protein